MVRRVAWRVSKGRDLGDFWGSGGRFMVWLSSFLRQMARLSNRPGAVGGLADWEFTLIYAIWRGVLHKF